MLRHLIIGLAAATLVGVTLLPDEGLARGFRGGGGRVGGYASGRAHVSHPIARGGAAYRGAAYRGAAYRGAAYRGAARGAAWGVGAAAVGAAAAGSYYGNYYTNSCYRDAYGRVICPHQYGY